MGLYISRSYLGEVLLFAGRSWQRGPMGDLWARVLAIEAMLTWKSEAQAHPHTSTHTERATTDWQIEGSIFLDLPFFLNWKFKAR